MSVMLISLGGSMNSVDRNGLDIASHRSKSCRAICNSCRSNLGCQYNNGDSPMTSNNFLFPVLALNYVTILQRDIHT